MERKIAITTLKITSCTWQKSSYFSVLYGSTGSESKEHWPCEKWKENW